LRYVGENQAVVPDHTVTCARKSGSKTALAKAGLADKGKGVTLYQDGAGVQDQAPRGSQDAGQHVIEQ
jgi:hypothetical protein